MAKKKVITGAMLDLDRLLDAVDVWHETKAEYDEALAKARAGGDVSWDWSGRHLDELHEAKDELRAALGDLISTAVAHIQETG